MISKPRTKSMKSQLLNLLHNLGNFLVFSIPTLPIWKMFSQVQSFYTLDYVSLRICQCWSMMLLDQRYKFTRPHCLHSLWIYLEPDGHKFIVKALWWLNESEIKFFFVLLFLWKSCHCCIIELFIRFISYFYYIGHKMTCYLLTNFCFLTNEVNAVSSFSKKISTQNVVLVWPFELFEGSFLL
jgi:hypothetical protein